MSTSGNTVEFSRLPSGNIKYIAYDANNDINIGGPILTELASYIQVNSYGRNIMSWEINSDCAGLTLPPSEPADQPNIFRFPIYCPNTSSYTWIYRRLRHEAGHMFGGGSGETWNGSTFIQNEGDLYDPMGKFNQLTGHFSACNKEVMGFIGPFGLRPFTLVNENGTYSITNIESQSNGSKALKILKNRWLLSKTDGTITQDIRWFYYLELRSNHQYITSSGKGKRKHLTQTIAPAIQVRQGRPVYKSEVWSVQQRMDLAIGNNGGFALGTTFIGEEILSEQKQFDPEPVITSRRVISVKIVALDTDKATVNVIYS